jgi:hypothetical protein
MRCGAGAWTTRDDDADERRGDTHLQATAVTTVDSTVTPRHGVPTAGAAAQMCPTRIKTTPQRCSKSSWRSCSSGRKKNESDSKLTLVVDHNFNLSVLHDANTRVCRAQIDTDDGARHSVAVFLDGLLVLGMCRLREHQAADEDEEQVEGDAPCRALARAP